MIRCLTAVALELLIHTISTLFMLLLNSTESQQNVKELLACMHACWHEPFAPSLFTYSLGPQALVLAARRVLHLTCCKMPNSSSMTKWTAYSKKLVSLMRITQQPASPKNTHGRADRIFETYQATRVAAGLSRTGMTDLHLGIRDSWQKLERHCLSDMQAVAVSGAGDFALNADERP